MIRYTRLLILLLLSATWSSCLRKPQTASLIIHNATIWTGNDKQPYAHAMAIAGDTILAIGDSISVFAYKGDDTEVLDVQKGFITPGFIDSHVHLLGGGLGLTSVQLTDAKSPQEFIDRIAAFAEKQQPGSWILYGQWDGSDWELPVDRSWIDSVTPNNPVFVWRLDGHQALANSLALQKANISQNTQEIAGGTIVRDKNGFPTGILKDKAMDLIYAVIPPSSNERLDSALQSAMRYMVSHGVTSLHNVWDPSDEKGFPAVFERARKNNKLITRIYDLEDLKDWQQIARKVDTLGKGDVWLKRNGVKGFVDGSLGSQTAAFYEPFLDQPGNKGFFINPEDSLIKYITGASHAGLQVAVHAIGDRAINFLLNTYEAIEMQQGNENQRFRIEHFQHLGKADLSRLSAIKPVASVQPYHVIDDGRWAAKYLDADRLSRTYAFRTMIDSNVVVAFGSDWPVAPPSPLWGIYAAVTRSTLDGKNPQGWIPEQKISVDEALRCYTKNAAYASFEEDIKGVLEPGKLADFVLLSDDITKIDPHKINEAKVLQTYIGGKKVFDYLGPAEKR